MALLSSISSPKDLKKLSKNQLPQLAKELRDFIIQSVSKTGGHLSSNLGTIELTIALHYVFNTPEDRLVWDVGHQAYPHKILTGRREQMKTLRQMGGLSGFPKRCESEYDAFGTAHSSTSISAILGMAQAAKLSKKDYHSIAVIGDGALTGGMAFEALNNAGVFNDLKMLVILNDNDMSISEPVGALNRHLAQILSGKFYTSARQVGKLLPAPMQEIAKRLEEQAKGFIAPTTLFEEFGFNYIGPIDGHDFDALLPTLLNLKELKGPQFLHVVTKKGHGYKLAEANPVLYHGLGKFNAEKGLIPKIAPRFTYSNIFGVWLCDAARQNDKIIGITPAMCEGSGMTDFAKDFPKRFFDVGIAEQHAVTFAAGLACEGYKPIVAIYSTFLQRAYDQVIHDVALQNLDVIFAIDRAGLVGADGATHSGNYDLAFLRCIPNMTIMTPSNEAELYHMLNSALNYKGPIAIRYPRGEGLGIAITRIERDLELAKASLLREGKKIAILAFGTILENAKSVAKHLDASLVNMRFVKPLDESLLLELAKTHDAFVTLEEGSISGGAGSAVAEFFASQNILKPMLHLGLPDLFIDHGEVSQLFKKYELDSEGIEAKIRRRFLENP